MIFGREHQMRTTHKLFIGAAALGAMTLSGVARAQVDIEPPLPNVLLLVDTSGSMDYKIDGSKVACTHVDPSLTGEPTNYNSEKSRWTQLVEVLTGDVQNYSCYSQDRSSLAFLQEYSLGAGSIEPYDKGYHVPYHRILSNGCTIGPGTLSMSDAFEWGTTPFAYHAWNSVNTSCSNFQQAATGLLDSFQDRARFSLMTFDTLTNPGTGLNGTKTPNFYDGVNGTWSYFLNWDTNPNCNTNGSCAKGRPAGCTDAAEAFEVGARNPAAPPWEGRLVPFGDPFAPMSQVAQTNQRIQQVLMAMRPFGATPINGMMADAQNFLLNDGAKDMVTGAASCNTTTGEGCFGPKDDGYVKGGCRDTYIILLTDGEPNLDLQPWCAMAGNDPGMDDGQCPYDKLSWEIAQDLAGNVGNPIKTFVVGFAVSSVELGGPDVVDCSEISSSTEFDPDGHCGPDMNPRMSACCALAKIAWYGGTTNAYFANDVNGLRASLSDILSAIAGTPTTRTLPVFSSSTSVSDSFAASYSFLSSFLPARGALWRGVLERRRTVCEAETVDGVTMKVPKDQDVTESKGDRFHENVNVEDPARPRRFYTTIRTAESGGTIWSKRSIRPNLTEGSNPDGVSAVGGSQVTGTTIQFPPLVPAKAMSVQQSACSGANPVANDQACAERFMGWQIGAQPSVAGLPSRVGNKFGDIFHSTPVVVTAPNEQLRDESYSAFAATQALRPPMLFTATNDGQLHAFKISKNPADTGDSFDVSTKTNNELWSYMPPAVLPDIPAQYPHTHQLLLDGKAIVKDVVFHRTQTQAQNGTGTWRTVLVAGFGAGRGGYYAIDITNPVPKDGVADSGPKLLWQLTTNDSGEPLFGDHGGTPAITTLFFDPDGGDSPAEYAVAILPGGDSGGPLSGNVLRKCQATSSCAASIGGEYQPRTQITAYPATAARSVTIVRLDTGEIVRSFRREGDPAGGIKEEKITPYAPLDSPMTGQPVVYPSTTGAVAHRAFIGDRDGTLWRINFTSANPAEWGIDLFFDGYPTSLSNGPRDGQPIDTPPILSVDNLGDLVVMFSTGDQESFTPSATMKNYVWSLRENSGTTAYKSEPLWFLPFTGGERVSGPMSLFNSVLYFSSFTPTGSSSLCSSGSSRIWGVDYIQSKDKDVNNGNVNIPSSGPVARLRDVDDTIPEDGILIEGKDAESSTIVFGIGIRQKPTCFDSDDDYDDPWFAGHTPMKNVTGGGFELVIQTGIGGTASGGAMTQTETRDLPAPPTMSRIDSWAAVVE